MAVKVDTVYTSSDLEVLSIELGLLLGCRLTRSMGATLWPGVWPEQPLLERSEIHDPYENGVQPLIVDIECGHAFSDPNPTLAHCRGIGSSTAWLERRGL